MNFADMSEDTFRRYFDLEGADAVCTICNRAIRKHTHCMRLHYAMHERQCTSPTPREEYGGTSGDDQSSEDDDDDPSYVSDTQCTDTVERIVKYLAICPRSEMFDAVIRHAPDGVIQAICNAAVKVNQLEVPLTEQQKERFQSNHPLFRELTSPTASTERKRKVIESQHGGFLPILISAALGALASHLFGGS